MDGEEKERETDILAVSDYKIFHNLENTKDRKSHTSDSYEMVFFTHLILQYTVKKTGRKFNRCLKFLSHRQLFPSVLYKIYARHHCLFFITEVGIKTLTLLMETNPIPRSKKYFRSICLNSVGIALSVGRIFSISSPPRFL
jgi:hypothetical protein